MPREKETDRVSASLHMHMWRCILIFSSSSYFVQRKTRLNESGPSPPSSPLPWPLSAVRVRCAAVVAGRKITNTKSSAASVLNTRGNCLPPPTTKCIRVLSYFKTPTLHKVIQFIHPRSIISPSIEFNRYLGILSHLMVSWQSGNWVILCF